MRNFNDVDPRRRLGMFEPLLLLVWFVLYLRVTYLIVNVIRPSTTEKVFERPVIGRELVLLQTVVGDDALLPELGLLGACSI